MLTNTIEMTLNEETIDAKKASVLRFLKSTWVKIKTITGPPIVFEGEVHTHTHTHTHTLKYFKILYFLRVKIIYCKFLFASKCHALYLVDDINSRQ